MATYRKIPARITVIDNVGLAQVKHKQHLKRAEQELTKIEGQVARGSLMQGVRKIEIGDNVRIECSTSFGRTEAVVIIGSTFGAYTMNEPCYCCSPCLVAGKIIEVYAGEELIQDGIQFYEKDEDYYADVSICQSVGNEAPRKITVYEECSSGGSTKMNERVVETHWVDIQLMKKAIFSDYQNHQVGDVVLVLVQPLYEFTPAPYGEYSPCVNYRKVVMEAVENPALACTPDFIESTGKSCQIAKDRSVWDNNLETEEVEESEIRKYYPFRILPIKIKSCL